MLRLLLYVIGVLTLITLSVWTSWMLLPLVVGAIDSRSESHTTALSIVALLSAINGYCALIIAMKHIPLQPRLVDVWSVYKRFALLMFFAYLFPCGIVWLMLRIAPNLDAWPYLVVFIVSLVLISMGGYAILFEVSPLNEFQRGMRLVTFLVAKARADAARPHGDVGIPFGGLQLPSSALLLHLLLVGSPGSGKTLTLRLLLQTLLKRILPGSDLRALIYDAKQDMLPILAGMQLSCEVLSLNPFEERGVAWNTSADITSPAAAYQTASILIPDEKNSSQPYFSDAARDILAGVFIALILTRGQDWTFLDVILITRSLKRLRCLLASTAETKCLLVYLTEARSTLDVMATLSTKLAPFRAIAAAWTHAERRVSLREWLEGEFILVLGNDETCRAALDAINRVLFQRITELVLAEPETEQLRFVFVLDEVRTAGKLEGLNSLLAKSRSKGASITMIMQDTEGLKDVYGESRAMEMLSQCSNKAVFRLESPHSAKWASDLVGHYDAIEIHGSEGVSSSQTSSQSGGQSGSQSGSSYSANLAEHYVKKEAILPSQFMSIPPTNRVNGLSGYYLSPITGVYFSTVDAMFLAKNLCPPDPSTPDILPRPESHQFLANAIDTDDMDDPDDPDEPDDSDDPDADPVPPAGPIAGSTGRNRKPYSHTL